MPKRGHGRGAIASIGLLLLLAGLLGGGLLWVLSQREPNRAAEAFARAAPGCTTTLTFANPGDYWVYEELSGVLEPAGGCVPSTNPGLQFTFDLRDATGRDLPIVEDESMTYDLDAGAATSRARFTITEPGTYEISVLGSDPAVVAAIGGDPEAGVARLRQGAIAAAIAGGVLGVLLLWASGRRSRRAATFANPEDPGWGVTERDKLRRAAAQQGESWPPALPDIRQVPVNPHAPDERRVAQLNPSPAAPSSAPSTAPSSELGDVGAPDAVVAETIADHATTDRPDGERADGPADRSAWAPPPTGATPHAVPPPDDEPS